MENFVYMNQVNIKNQNSLCFVISLCATLNKTLAAKSNDILPRTPKARPKSKIYIPKQDDKHPRPFHMGVPPQATGWHVIEAYVSCWHLLICI